MSCAMSKAGQLDRLLEGHRGRREVLPRRVLHTGVLRLPCRFSPGIDLHGQPLNEQKEGPPSGPPFECHGYRPGAGAARDQKLNFSVKRNSRGAWY
jgi:hypothetical protein